MSEQGERAFYLAHAEMQRARRVGRLTAAVEMTNEQNIRQLYAELLRLERELSGLRLPRLYSGARRAREHAAELLLRGEQLRLPID